MCLPHSLCLSFSLPVSHLPPPSHLFPAALFYHFIFSLLPTPLLSFSLSGPNLFHASCMLTLSLAGWLIHRIVCSPQVYPRKSTPAVDRLCVGVPAAEVSQMPLHLWNTSATVCARGLSCINTFDYFLEFISNILGLSSGSENNICIQNETKYRHTRVCSNVSVCRYFLNIWPSFCLLLSRIKISSKHCEEEQ